ARYGWQRRVVRSVAALLLLGLCGVLLIAVQRLTHALSTRTVVRLQAQVSHTHRQVGTLVPNSQNATLVPPFFGLLRMAVSLALLIVTFQLLLWIYPPTRWVASHVIAAVAAPIKQLLAQFWANAPNLMVVAIIGFTTYYLLRFINFFFQKIEDRT